MLTKFSLRRDPLGFCCLLVIGLLLLAAPSAIGADLKVEGVDGELALRRTIRLKMANLPEWLKNSENRLSQLSLYVDGTAFKDPRPSLVQGDTLIFDLRRTEQNKDAWTTLLCRKGDSFFSRSVPVTVGFENGTQVPSAANSVTLIRVNELWFQAFAIIVFLLILLFLYLATESDILRDTGPLPKKPHRKTYSLARTQMALWTLTIIIGYVFIWMVTSDLSSLTPGVLGLMGISAVTGLGSAIVDSTKESEQNHQRWEHEEKKKTAETEAEKLRGHMSVLEAAINARTPPANLDERKAAYAVKKAELAAQENEIELRGVKIDVLDHAAKPSVSEGFIKDLLNDDHGVSFHRFQISVWTIVLIFIFIGRVLDTLTMPTFDATLLALMGISGGTYIGFKLPDKQG